jgi:hypothetical protein
MKLAYAVVLSLALVGACNKKEAERTPTPPPPAPTAASGDAPGAAPRVVGDGVTGGGGPVAQVRLGGDPNEPQHALPLTIEVVHENQKPTTKAPFYAPGGKWTYLDLKTPGGNTFTVGLTIERELKGDMPITTYGVRAYAADAKQGAAVLDELAKALRVPVPPSVKTTKPLLPLAMVASSMGGELARNSDGSFSGAGTWRATKWTTERADHAAEIFFNFSLTEKKAELSEKDTDYNADVIADLTLAFRDGGLSAEGK